jgi:hypothetical protein
MISWFADRCRYCRRVITCADRLDWADDWVWLCLLAVAIAFGSLVGLVLFQVAIPIPILAMMNAVTIAGWYLLHVSPSRRERIVG